MQILSITDARYSNPEKTAVDCLVTFDTIGHPVPFTARGDILDTNTQLVWGKLHVEGEEIEIAPYKATQADIDTQARKILGAGATVTSKSMPALNGVYGVDEMTILNMAGVHAYIDKNRCFPGKCSNLAWMDAAGKRHVFDSVNGFLAFADGVNDFVAAVHDWAHKGGEGKPPSNLISIP